MGRKCDKKFLLRQSIDLDALIPMVSVSQIVTRRKYFSLKLRLYAQCTHTFGHVSAAPRPPLARSQTLLRLFPIARAQAEHTYLHGRFPLDTMVPERPCGLRALKCSRLPTDSFSRLPAGFSYLRRTTNRIASRTAARASRYAWPPGTRQTWVTDFRLICHVFLPRPFPANLCRTCRYGACRASRRRAARL